MNRKTYIMVAILFLLLGLNIRPVVALSQATPSEEIRIKEIINAYFQLRYESLKSLTPADFSTVSDMSKTSTITDEWLRREQDRQDIEITIAETFKTSYLEYKFFLNYQSIEISGAEAVVKLLEGNEVYYVDAPKLPSKMANLEHVITLRNVNGEWKVANDQYRSETTQLLETLSKEEILKNIQYNYDAQFITPTIEGQTQPEATYSYNGTKAASYADTWYGSINPIYHDAGLDCTNFASQGIYEGTNKTMSNPDNYNTKWYYDFYTHSGSYPWVNVGGIFTFLTTNTGKGPYGYHSGAYTCNLSKGHIVTMKQSGSWKHTVIVSTFSGDCHDPSKILVDSHDPDYYRKPLSNWSGYTWYAITISGYRK